MMTMMNKKNAQIILPAVIVVTAGVIMKICVNINRKNKERKTNRFKSRCSEFYELNFCISSVLKDDYVTDFDRFAEYLDEYYNIQAEIKQDNAVVYSSSKFNSPISCYEMFNYDLDDLEHYFTDNRKKRIPQIKGDKDEICEFHASIRNVVKTIPVRSFDEFADCLKKYCNITAVLGQDNEIIYSHPAFKNTVTSSNLGNVYFDEKYDLCALERIFECYRTYRGEATR